MNAISELGPCSPCVIPATLRVVTAPPSAEMHPEDPAPKTLGDLVYPDPERVGMRESEWVRLLQGVAAGDQGALYAIYARIHRIVFTYVVRIVKSRETAEELTADVFHDVWKRAGNYQPASGTVLGWIMNQARSRAIDRLRFEQRKKRAPLQHQESQAGHEDVADGAEAMLEAADQGRRLKDALTALTPDEREAIETAFFLEYTYVETAVWLKQPLGTVKTRIRSGLAKLRQKMVPGSEES